MFLPSPSPPSAADVAGAVCSAAAASTSTEPSSTVGASLAGPRDGELAAELRVVSDRRTLLRESPLAASNGLSIMETWCCFDSLAEATAAAAVAGAAGAARAAAEAGTAVAAREAAAACCREDSAKCCCVGGMRPFFDISVLPASPASTYTRSATWLLLPRTRESSAMVKSNKTISTGVRYDTKSDKRRKTGESKK